MTRSCLILAAFLLLVAAPGHAFASTLTTGRTLVISEPPVDNAYLAGTDVTVVAPLPADLLAAGGTLSVSGPVAGDAMLAGGTVNIRKPIAGDARIVAGQLSIDAPIAGDFIAAAGSITASTTAKDTRLAGGTVRLTGGGGPVTIYGADVYLAGDFKGDVMVVASDRLVLAENTRIAGTLKYNAPQEASIPGSSVVAGGVSYIGSSSYLPTNEEAKRFAIAGAGVLFVVKVLAALITAGLVAGLFPAFSNAIADAALSHSLRRFVLLALLGFGVVVAAPVLILLLLVSFVGIGIALMLLALYLLLLMLSYLYAGLLTGAALSRGILKRTSVSWRDAVVGMLVLSLIGVIPGIGIVVVLALAAASAGTLLSLGYGFAFGRNQDDDDLLLP